MKHLTSDNQSLSAFLALVRAGLWETEVRLLPFNDIDYTSILSFAEEQSVVGLVTAGMECVTDVKVPQEYLLQFIGQALQIEQRNLAMNAFIETILCKIREKGLKIAIVKGQGVAQCYERPMWRSAGDIDLFVDRKEYEAAKQLLIAEADSVQEEEVSLLHLGLTFGQWVVELHGTMYTQLSNQLNSVIDLIQDDIFRNNGVRVWKNGKEEIFLPNPDNDVVIIFTHFIHHFYVGGIGMRQICDWCRLIWTYRESFNTELLEKRLNEMGLMEEWRCFAALAVKELGMPEVAMPLYGGYYKYEQKVDKLLKRIIAAGKEHKDSDESYREQYPKAISHLITFGRRFAGFSRVFSIFPQNTPKFFLTYVFGRTKAII